MPDRLGRAGRPAAVRGPKGNRGEVVECGEGHLSRGGM